MNKNSKHNFNIAKKNAARGKKQTSFDIPKVLDGRGESTSWGKYGEKIISFETKPRVHRYAKVARSGKKSRAELVKEQEQEAASIELAKIEDARHNADNIDVVEEKS